MSRDRLIHLDAASRTSRHPRAATAAEDARRAVEAGESGRDRAAELWERAAAQVAASAGARPHEVRFTPGGAAANRAAPRSAGALRPGRIVLAALEHASLREAALARAEVVEVPVLADGRVDVDRWAAEVARPGTALAAVHHGGHATGTLQPVAECSGLAREAGVLVHTDAAQSLPALPVSAAALGVDRLAVWGETCSAGPGTGALIVRGGAAGEAPPVPSHEAALPAAAALGAALEALGAGTAEVAGRLWALSGRLRGELAGLGAIVLGHPTHRVPHLVSWAVPEASSESMRLGLRERGVAADAVAAGPLARAGLVPAGAGVIRFGLRRDATDETVDRAMRAVRDLLGATR